MKKLKHLFMLCLFIMTSIGASAKVYSGMCGDNAQWSFDTMTSLLSITGSGKMTDYSNSLDIPWFYYTSNIKSLSIGDQITSIGNNAFEYCSGLTSVTIPNSVTSIGAGAFQFCYVLTSVAIPNSVTTIGDYAFYECSGLTSVTIPYSVTSIGDGAFKDCSGLTSVAIPNSVTSIGSQTFSGCSSLKSVTIHNSVTSIGDYAFRDCYALKSVTIPNSVTSIDDLAFYGCTSLTSLTIPNSVTSIGEGAFAHCTGLTSIKVESGNKLYDSRDNCNAIIETASNTLISGCKKTIIPNSVTSIGEKAFYYCTSLTSMTIPNSVTSIGDYAFSDCQALTSITIPNSVTSIGENAFHVCSGLTSVTIGNSVTLIGEDAFSYCNNVKELIYTDGTKTVLRTYLTSIKSVTIPNSVITIGHAAFSGCSDLTSVTIPNSVISIGNYAFSECSGLINMIIPNSVTEIGHQAFEYCRGLTSVTIPNSVTSIGRTTFWGCSGLKSVNITDLDKWAEIEFGDSYANPLYYAHNLYLNGELVTNAELTTAKKIGSNAFFYCSSLTSVTIGNSVTSIGDGAFNACTKLTSVIADGINAPTIGSICFKEVKNCSLHVPSGSEDSYASKFGTYFKSGNTYGNTIETYSAYSKSSAGEYSFEIWGAFSDVVLSEGAEKVYVPVEATVNSLQYKRTFNNTDWQALYVPFELDVKTDLADFSVYEISTSSADAINVTLMTEGKTLTNTPYLIKAKATGEQAIPVSSKKVEVTVENTNSELSDFEIVGTYAKLNYGDISGDWYALKGGKFMKAGEGAYLNPYRFYLKRKASSAKESIEININEPTGITSYENDNDNENENENLYNLNGMRVDSNYKGIVIINGKKYLKK